MPLTLDGIPLVSDPALEDEALGMLDPLDAPEWGGRSWPDQALASLDGPWGPFRSFGPPSGVGTINWPSWGLSRFASGHFLCHATSAQDLRHRQALRYREEEGVEDSSGGAGPGWNSAIVLRMEAETQTNDFANGEVVDFSVFLLPPRPVAAPDVAVVAVPGLGEVETSAGCYLLTVVDRRYFLRGRSVRADLDLDLGCDATWAGLLALLAADAGIALEVGEVDADYLVPPGTLEALSGRDVAQAIDAVAASAGMRVVAHRDGTFSARTAPVALAARQADDDLALARGRRRLGGGDQYVDIF